MNLLREAVGTVGDPPLRAHHPTDSGRHGISSIPSDPKGLQVRLDFGEDFLGKPSFFSRI